MALPSLDDYFPDWKEREALAEAMIPIIGRLYRKNVVTYCYGRALHNESVTRIMKTHRYVRQVTNIELSEFESYPILEALSQLDLGPSHIDVGKLATNYMAEAEGNGITPMAFCERECAEVIGRHVPPLEKPQDVVLYGFGRIGRLLARLLVEKTGSGQQLRVRAIVVRKGSAEGDLLKRASLLRRAEVLRGFWEGKGAAGLAQHPEGLLVEVENGFQFLAVAGIHLAQADDLAHHLGVEALALGLGIDLADIRRQGRLFFFQALDSLDKGPQAFRPDATDIRHSHLSRIRV